MTLINPSKQPPTNDLHLFGVQILFSLFPKGVVSRVRRVVGEGYESYTNHASNEVIKFMRFMRAVGAVRLVRVLRVIRVVRASH